MLIGRAVHGLGLATYIIQLVLLGIYIFWRRVHLITAAIVNNLIICK